METQTQLRACFVCSVDSKFYTSVDDETIREVKPKLDVKTDRVCQGPSAEQAATVCRGDRKDLASCRLCVKPALKHKLLLTFLEKHISGVFLHREDPNPQIQEV